MPPARWNKMMGPPHVWYSDHRPPVRHEGFTYGGGRGSSLLDCRTCGLSTTPKAWGATPQQRREGDHKLRREFDRMHRAAARRPYTGRHRAPVPRERMRVM